MLVDPHIILHLDVLQANISQRLYFNPHILQRFLVSSYDDELKERADRDLIVPVLNASQIHYICQVLLRI